MRRAVLPCGLLVNMVTANILSVSAGRATSQFGLIRFCLVTLRIDRRSTFGVVGVRSVLPRVTRLVRLLDTGTGAPLTV